MNDIHQSILEAIEIIPTAGKTRLIAVMVDTQSQDNLNALRPISCSVGRSFARGYAYDQSSDSYLVSCVAIADLGYIPVSYQINIKSADWRTDVPLPLPVVEKIMTRQMKQSLDAFKETHSDNRYEVRVIQLADCNR